MSDLILCCACKEEKAIADYQPSRIKAKKAICRACQNAKNRLWYEENKEVRNEKIKKYRIENVVKVKEYEIGYRSRNRNILKDKKQEYHRSLWGYSIYLYGAIRSRLVSATTYKNRAVHFTKIDFLKWLEESDYVEHYCNWAYWGFPQVLSPTVDRVDNDRGYSLDNIQILPQFANARKGQFETAHRRTRNEKGQYNPAGQ